MCVSFAFYFYCLDHYAIWQMNIISKTPLNRIDICFFPRSCYTILPFLSISLHRFFFYTIFARLFSGEYPIRRVGRDFRNRISSLSDVLDSIFHTHHVHYRALGGYVWDEIELTACLYIPRERDAMRTQWKYIRAHTHTYNSLADWGRETNDVDHMKNKKIPRLHVFHLIHGGRDKKSISVLLDTVFRIYIRINFPVERYNPRQTRNFRIIKSNGHDVQVEAFKFLLFLSLCSLSLAVWRICVCMKLFIPSSICTAGKQTNHWFN